MEATNLADIYGLPLLDWARVESRLEWKLEREGEPLPDHHCCSK
jgi:hypothetical protein